MSDPYRDGELTQLRRERDELRAETVQLKKTRADAIREMDDARKAQSVAESRVDELLADLTSLRIQLQGSRFTTFRQNTVWFLGVLFISAIGVLIIAAFGCMFLPGVEVRITP